MYHLFTVLPCHDLFMANVNIILNMVESNRSRGREFDPGPVPYFRVD